MKIRQDSDLWLICILTLLLVLIIAFFPTSIARITILGLPLVLFFPGYALIAALFPRRESLSGIERVALSFGLNIAVVPLIGLILNYTPWGIRLYPVLISLTVFILAMSGIAWYRRVRLGEGERFKVPFNIGFSSMRGQSMVDRALSVVLVLAIVGAIGIVGYVVAKPKVGEKFTEFYVLGSEGKAEEYPAELRLGEKVKIILGIINHEREKMNYQVKVTINSTEEEIKIWVEDNGELLAMTDNTIEIEALANEEKWERVLLFEPLQKGENQKVGFLCFSPKLRENHHICSQLSSGNYVDIEINESEGRGKITLDSKSTGSHSYRLEVWQKGVIQSEISFTVAGGEKLEREFQFPPDESNFQLYENEALTLKDTGAELSLHLWMNVS